MWTDDDVLTTRWRRWHRRVMALNFDALLRWVLVANVVTVTVFSLLAILAAGVTAVAAVVAWIGR